MTVAMALSSPENHNKMFEGENLEKLGGKLSAEQWPHPV